MGYRVHNEGKNYKVVFVNGGSVYDVITGLTQNKAITISSNLNYGGGFDGKTPDFFNTRIERTYESNEQSV